MTAELARSGSRLRGDRRPGLDVRTDVRYAPGAVTEQMFDTGPNRAPRTRRSAEESTRVQPDPRRHFRLRRQRHGTPREIRTDGQRLAITALESVRDETSAYPLESGPRTVFVVRAAERRFRLIHQLDDRRWTIEDLGGRGSRLRGLRCPRARRPSAPWENAGHDRINRPVSAQRLGDFLEALASEKPVPGGGAAAAVSAALAASLTAMVVRLPWTAQVRRLRRPARRGPGSFG